MKMKAKDLFRDLGFEKLDQNDKALVYAYEDDYNRGLIYFDLKIWMYTVTYERFIDNLYDYVPMEERPENTKHSCRYGYWQREDFLINTKLHNAIHQQIAELGWIK